MRLEGGRVQAGPWGWISPFTIMGGLIGLAICAYLTPIYMTVRTRGDLREDFRRRGLIAALVLGVLTTLEIPVAYLDAPQFAARLASPRTLVWIFLAVCLGSATEILLWRRRFLAAQIGAGATVACTLIGYGAALYPDLLIGQLTIPEAAAPRETLMAFFTVLPFGVIILLPSLLFLYWTFRGSPDPDARPEEFKLDP